MLRKSGTRNHADRVFLKLPKRALKAAKAPGGVEQPVFPQRAPLQPSHLDLRRGKLWGR